MFNSEDNLESIDSVSSLLSGTEVANLYSVINRDNVHGLNLTVPEDAKEIIKPWHQRDDTTRFADSGVDDQVIIHVPFAQNVRVRSILLKLGRGEATPRRLQIYANYPNIIDFADAETTRPQLNISLREGETEVTEYPLRVAAFTSINSLSLFFSESVGGEVSRIYYLGFKGDIRDQRKEANTKLSVPAADAADAPLVDTLAEKRTGQQDTAR